MIYYFSGTGNTRFVADCLADCLGEKQMDMAGLLRRSELLQSESERPHIFLAPIYAWRYPLPVEELIRHSVLTGNKEVYCIATRESQSGKAGDYLQKIVESKELIWKGFTSVDMPNEYLLSDPVSSPDQTRAYLRGILPDLHRLADRIRAGEMLTDQGNVGMPGLMSGIVNAASNRFLMTSRSFTVSGQCVGCGACARLCPMKNIEMKEGRPVFGKNCTWCFSCIQHCPKAAIDVGKRTTGKPRYVCPDYRQFMKDSAE